jgi:hypothetical protein
MVRSSSEVSLADRNTGYVHAVRADDDHWTDVWNFSLEGTRSSIGLINTAMSYPKPCDVDLAVLAGSPRDWPLMVSSGFMATLRLGAIVCAGGWIGRGVAPHPTKWATHEAREKVLRNADRELALEAGRRKHAQSAPSRLCCLWLADDTVQGRRWQRTMGHQSFLMRVQITIALASCRCDARWIDHIHADPSNVDAVMGYWSGRAYDNDPHWEYLLEGQIAARDTDELQRLRDFIKTQGPPADMLGPPSPRESTDA